MPTAIARQTRCGRGGTLRLVSTAELGRGIWGKGMEAKEWGQGNFSGLFLCLHSFANPVPGS